LPPPSSWAASRSPPRRRPYARTGADASRTAAEPL
jgi:hypothetical protein